MKKRISLKLGTKHSTESEDGSQGVGGVVIQVQKGARLGRRPLQGQEGGASPAPTKECGAPTASGAATRVDSVGGGCAGGDGGRFADGVAVDYKFDAAISLAALSGVVGGYGLSFAKAAGGH